MKKFILFLLVAFMCIACEPRKEQAYSKHSGTMDIDTVTIHGLKHEFIYSYGRGEIRKGECFIDLYGDTLEQGEGVDRSYVYDRNTLPNKQSAEAHLALIKLHQLRDCYRQGWKPNLTIPESIFAIFCTKGKYSVEEFIYSSEFLSFQSKQLAQEFLNNFRDLILQAGDLI